MKYTLITANGKVHTFFLQTVAETYQKAYGGVVISQQILVDRNSKRQYNINLNSKKESNANIVHYI